MQFYRPIKTNLITQGFGENRNTWYKQFGMLGHNGLDLLANDNEPLYWHGSGRATITQLSTEPNEGLGIVAITEDNGIYQHRFWHLKDICVSVGQVVETGQLLGHCDNTGLSTGTHLHYDLKPMVMVNGRLQQQIPDNGYFGAIDPTPFISFIFVLDVINNLQTQLNIIQQIMVLFNNIFKKKYDPKSIEWLIRRIAKEYGVDQDKAMAVAIKENSTLNPYAIGKNKDSRKTTDRGLWQINSFWHSEITDEQAFDPEFSTRFFCKMVKQGRATEWFGAENILWVWQTVNGKKKQVLI